MAEMIGNDRKGKRTSARNIRVDLTPMVDLGFLLITFFILTKSMSESKVMDTVVPNDKDTSTDKICESCALTLVAGKNNDLFYYEGMDKDAQYKKTNYSAAGLRDLIIKKKEKVMSLLHKDRFILIIKPSPASNFKNLVDIIDESTICNVKRYYLAELNESDKKIVQ